jgi:hypothetical protein
MKLSVLGDALFFYGLNCDHSYEEYAEIKKALQQVVEQLRQANNSDCEIWPDEVALIHSSLVCEWSNTMWYNIYGRLARRGKVTLEQFASAVRAHEFPYGQFLADSWIEAGFNYIADLWHKNESVGANRKDGSLCRYLSDDDYELIDSILCDKLDEAVGGERYESIMQAKRRLTAMFKDKWTTYCGKDTCDNCEDSSACRSNNS